MVKPQRKSLHVTFSLGWTQILNILKYFIYGLTPPLELWKGVNFFFAVNMWQKKFQQKITVLNLLSITKWRFCIPNILDIYILTLQGKTYFACMMNS